MKISTATSGMVDMTSLQEGLKIIADAGFEAVDFSMFTHAWNGDLFAKYSDAEFADYFRGIKKYIKDLGMETCQTHAPFPLKVYNPAQDPGMLSCAIRSIYATAHMDSPYVVFHPAIHPAHLVDGDIAEGLQSNVEFFGAMADALRDTGVTVCIENVWHFLPGSDTFVRATCSSAESLCELIDTLNDRYGPHYAACLDTGHALMLGDNCASMVKSLGSRLKVLHVHDNDGTRDMHQAPGKGKINWREFCEALRETGYSGTFNFEADWFWADYRPADTYSKEVLCASCSMVYAIGRSLTSIVDGTFVHR